MDAYSIAMKMLIFSLLAVLACAETPQPPAAPARVEAPMPIATDQSHYALKPGRFGPEARIVATLRAPRERAFYVYNCNGAISAGLQRRVGSEWVNAWVAEINGCFSPPLVIAAGQTLTLPMTVVSREHHQIHSGTYRVVWHGVVTNFNAGVHPPTGDDVPVEQRVSAPIVIEAPRL